MNNERPPLYLSPNPPFVLYPFYASIAVSLVGIVAAINQYNMLSAAAMGRQPTEAEIEFNSSLMETTSSLQIIVAIITIIAFLLWFNRSYKNLYHFNVQGLRFSSGWAVGYFFIPILGLYRPYQVAQEIWRGSAPDNRQSGNPEQWKENPGSNTILWWWISFLVSNVITQIVFRLSDRTESLEEVISLTLALIPSHLSVAVGAVLAILFIRQLHERQHARAA